MKYSRHIGLVVLMFMITVACNEDQLSLTNPNQLSPDTFFKTEVQVQSAVNAAYANMQTRGLFSRHWFFMNDNMAHENEGNPQLEADKRQYLEFTFNSAHGAIGNYWSSCFRGINKANFVIGNSESINALTDAQLSATNKAKFIGEAKFLRALYYYFLVTKFGGVPLITDIVEGEDGFPRSSVDAVYTQIITDLKDAQSTLLSKDVEDQGRATAEAATALLGKVYLYNEDYTSAKTELSKLIGVFSLEDNFYNNFMEQTEHGVESIFEVEYDANLGTSSVWNSAESGEGLNESTFRGQEYGMFDWFNVYPSDVILDEFEEGDLRFAETFYSVGDEYIGGTIESINNNRRAGWKKYQNYYQRPNENTHSSINFKLIRYSDVLLMLAECENELGNQEAAVSYINEVRTRAGLAGVSVGSQSEVFDAIVHERMVEFAGEQSRFNDLIRWGMAAEVLGEYGFQSNKNELLPIPDNEIASNSAISQADQNPGY